MNFLASIQSMFSGFFEKRLWTPHGGGRTTTAREVVSEDSALNYSAVWCATRMLCGTGASLPLPIYRGLDSEERSKDRAHPLFRLLNRRPNPEMTAYNFRSVMWQWQVNWGNAYAEITREGDDPDAPLTGLWPLHPARVTPCRTRDTSETLYYDVRDDTTGVPVDVEAWRILHIPSIITYDGITGHGVIQHARESIGAGIAAEKYGAHWFGGAAVPRVVMENTPTSWTPEQKEQFRKEWDELHSGADGHRIALLYGQSKVVPLSLSAEDSQFLETRQFGVEEVARWYGVPPHLLQHLLRATFNNVEELGRNFVEYSLVPWLRTWEQCIAHKLLTEEEQETYFAEHNADALMRGKATERAAFYQSMTSAALMNRNECRKLENLDPIGGGDTFLVQGAMVPLDDEGKPESKFATPGTASITPPRPTVPTDDEPPADDNDEQALSTVAGHLHRIIGHDLGRFLTKEAKAMANFARKPEEFLSLVESFYADHTAIVRDELTETFGALVSCGVTVSADLFVTGWVEEGKSLIVEASGRAKTLEELKTVVKTVIESRTWTERPVRAVEGVKNATACV
jgi:HK97 family phage portal protein